MNDGHHGQPADPAAAVAAAHRSLRWGEDGNVAVGLLCGITLSAPVWAAAIGAVRALLG